MGLECELGWNLRARGRIFNLKNAYLINYIYLSVSKYSMKFFWLRWTKNFQTNSLKSWISGCMWMQILIPVYQYKDNYTYLWVLGMNTKLNLIEASVNDHWHSILWPTQHFGGPLTWRRSAMRTSILGPASECQSVIFGNLALIFAKYELTLSCSNFLRQLKI